MLIVLLLMNLIVDDSLEGVKCHFTSTIGIGKPFGAFPIPKHERVVMNLPLDRTLVANFQQAMKLLQTTSQFELPTVPPTGDILACLYC